jgi:hypothetical protein
MQHGSVDLAVTGCKGNKGESGSLGCAVGCMLAISEATVCAQLTSPRGFKF